MITVDSAQAGIFDFAFFGKDEKVNVELDNVYDIEMNENGSKYYVVCCDTIASEQQGGIVPGGAVAMSGYGDGLYKVYIEQVVSGEIVSVMVEFLRNEQDE